MLVFYASFLCYNFLVMKTLIKYMLQEKLVLVKSNIIPIKSFKTVNIYLKTPDTLFNSLNEEYLLICGLNKTSIFGLLFTLYVKTMLSSQLKSKIVLTSPQYVHSLFINSHQLIHAKYFSFIPYNIKSIVISKQIDYIGQRWFARFANCFILIYKKI